MRGSSGNGKLWWLKPHFISVWSIEQSKFLSRVVCLRHLLTLLYILQAIICIPTNQCKYFTCLAQVMCRFPQYTSSVHVYRFMLAHIVTMPKLLQLWVDGCHCACVCCNLMIIQVEEWYDRRETIYGKSEERRVYLATDDKSALSEATSGYVCTAVYIQYSSAQSTDSLEWQPCLRGFYTCVSGKRSLVLVH